MVFIQATMALSCNGYFAGRRAFKFRGSHGSSRHGRLLMTRLGEPTEGGLYV